MVVVSAQAEARAAGNDFTGPELLTLGLLAEPESIAIKVLADYRNRTNEI